MINNLLKPTSFRYERKFFISGIDRYEIESIIKKHPAMFIEVYPQRYVNNIYIDTNTMAFYFDNVDGLSQRLKVRIRWYGNLFGDVEKPILEFKVKKDLVGGKVSHSLKSFYLDGKYSQNALQELFAESGLSNDLVEYLKPLQFSLLNRYSRKYFESADRKFRITIDFDMKFYKLYPIYNSFNEKIMDYSNTVVELKYSDKHDDIAQSITNQFQFRVTKSSKYVMGIGGLY